MLHDITPRMQRLIVKLQRYDYDMWMPGKYLHRADTLSRALRCDRSGTGGVEQVSPIEPDLTE